MAAVRRLGFEPMSKRIEPGIRVERCPLSATPAKRMSASDSCPRGALAGSPPRLFPSRPANRAVILRVVPRLLEDTLGSVTRPCDVGSVPSAEHEWCSLRAPAVSGNGVACLVGNTFFSLKKWTWPH